MVARAARPSPHRTGRSREHSASRAVQTPASIPIPRSASCVGQLAPALLGQVQRDEVRTLGPLRDRPRPRVDVAAGDPQPGRERDLHAGTAAAARGPRRRCARGSSVSCPSGVARVRRGATPRPRRRTRAPPRASSSGERGTPVSRSPFRQAWRTMPPGRTPRPAAPRRSGTSSACRPSGISASAAAKLPTSPPAVDSAYSRPVMSPAAVDASPSRSRIAHGDSAPSTTHAAARPARAARASEPQNSPSESSVDAQQRDREQRDQRDQRRRPAAPPRAIRARVRVAVGEAGRRASSRPPGRPARPRSCSPTRRSRRRTRARPAARRRSRRRASRCRATNTTTSAKPQRPRRSRSTAAALIRGLPRRVGHDRGVDQPLDRRAVVGEDVAAAQRGSQPPGALRRSGCRSGGTGALAQRLGAERRVGGDHERVQRAGSGRARRARTPRPCVALIAFSSAGESLGWPMLTITDPPGFSRSRTSSKNSRVVR